MKIMLYQTYSTLNESLSSNNFYDLFGQTVYVEDTDYRGGNEYIITYRLEDGSKNNYVGEIKDIEEDFNRTDNSFELSNKPKTVVKKTPPKKTRKKRKPVEFFNIVFWQGNRKTDTIRYNIHKSHAHALRGYFQKLEKYRNGTVKLEPNK